MSNQDIFKIVQEVEKQKRASLDELYEMLDDAQNVNSDKSVVDVKAKVNQAIEPANLLNIRSNVIPSTRISLPSFPPQVTFDTRLDCFRALIEGVNYGKENSLEYVNAHRQALEDVYRDASNNAKDLYVIEARVNDEINRTISKTTIAEKGYYDGLMYALKAIRKSKTMMMDKIVNILNNSLK